MPAVIDTAVNHIRKFWFGITAGQRMFVAGLATIMVAVFIGLLVWLNQPEMTPLYTNLSAEDANRVLKQLESQKVPYKLEQNGSAIMVPADRVHALRIGIAGENMLTGQGVGFEIFNDVKMGRTDFVTRLDYRRALEGELVRTISEFPAIETARVHLVIPNRSLFIEEQMKPSASVLLKLAGSKKLEPKDVQAIVNLVTMAVEGLDKSRVAIADTNGKVLYQPEEEGSIDGLTRTQHEHKILTQQNLERRIEELLLPVMGAGRISARVNADLDFSQKSIHRTVFDPEKAVTLSEVRSEESTDSKAAINSEVPDPNFRGDGPTGTQSTGVSSRENRTTNYDYNKEEQNIVTTGSTLERLTVAVIVDGTYTTDAEGKTVFNARTEEELERIKQQVMNAVGFSAKRGDTIDVSCMPFSGIEIAPETTTASILMDYALRFGKPMLNAALVFLFLMLVVRPVVLALIRPKVEGKMLEGLEGLPQTEELLALAEDDDTMAAATAVLEKIEDIKAHALQLSEQNMEQAVGIIKSWIKDGVKPVAAQVPAKAA